ncbi:hypothetical protein GCM10022380_51960 [Amycolatopsis tucumanensis]|uniref:Transposase n=1 Tax=Amycolatopsis tucumanensis TaxID=401106 RepID=A0ABP7ITZ9_9PSEU
MRADLAHHVATGSATNVPPMDGTRRGRKSHPDLTDVHFEQQRLELGDVAAENRTVVVAAPLEGKRRYRRSRSESGAGCIPLLP